MEPATTHGDTLDLLKRRVDMFLANARASNRTPGSLIRIDAPRATGSIGALTRDDIARVSVHLDKLRSRSHPAVQIDTGNKEYETWRRRKIAAIAASMPGGLSDPIAHLPFAIELAKGCSRGCWFCCFDAAPLTDTLKYQDAKSLWRGVLSELSRYFGAIGAYGILYWATDPLDNSDYELFVNDFTDEFGKFPTTTTALASRQEHRIRQLVTMAEDHSGLLRLSLTSPEEFAKVLASFPARELLNVELVPQFRGSLYQMSFSGRFRNALRRSSTVLNDELDKTLFNSEFTTGSRQRLQVSPGRGQVEMISGTSACVTGILINLCDQICRVVAPVNASDLNPFGYSVEYEFTFETPREMLGRVRDYFTSCCDT